MGNITQSMEEIQDPTDGIQSYMHNQLATLRADVLKYQELLEDYRKTQLSSAQLDQQHETLKEKHTKQEESLQRCQEQVKDLETKYSLLESELETWKDKACNHGTDPAQFEQQADSLRSQIEQTKEDLQEARTALSHVQTRFEDQAKELVTTKVRKFHKRCWWYLN